MRRGGGKRSGWFQTSLKSSKVRLAVLKRTRVHAKRRKIVTLCWTPAGTLRRRRVMGRKKQE